MKRIYLSGAMTGYPDLNFPAFNAAARELRAKGFDVANPAEIEPTGEKTWANCMKADIKALCDCCTVHCFPGGKIAGARTSRRGWRAISECAWWSSRR